MLEIEPENTADDFIENVVAELVDYEDYVYQELSAGGAFNYEFMMPYDLILGEHDYDTYEVYVLSAFDDN